MYFGHLYTNAFQHTKNKGNLFSDVKVIGPLLAGLPLKSTMALGLACIATGFMGLGNWCAKPLKWF
jgi:hypothetical protein